MLPDTNDSDLLIAIQWHRSNNILLAEKLYRAFLIKNPNHPLVLSLLGTIYIQKKSPKEAIALFKQSIKLDRNDSFSFCTVSFSETS